MIPTSSWIITTVGSLVLAGCSATPPLVENRLAQPTAVQSDAAGASRKVLTKTLAEVGLDKSAMDLNADPCKDFYQFACGSWLAATEIPKTHSAWYRSFSAIAKQNQVRTIELLQKASADPNGDPISRQVGDYFASCMDENAIDAAGVKPIKQLLNRVRTAETRKEFAALVGELHLSRIWVLFDIVATVNVREGGTMLAWLDQNGLGLPDRSYYLANDDQSTKVKAAYAEHVDAIMKLSGLSPAASRAAAADVIQIETALAELFQSATERRNPKATHNKVDRRELASLAPQFDWDTYFATVGLGSIAEADVGARSFFQGVGKILGSKNLDGLRNYLRWRIVSSMTPALPRSFRAEREKLDGALYGTTSALPRERQCVQETDKALRDWVGALFARSETPDNKPETARISREIARAFEQELGTLPWMDAQTREKALTKLHAMRFLIGTPDLPRSYDFPVERKAFAKNLLRARSFDTTRDLARVGKPLNRADWGMSTIAAAAGYNHSLNAITITLGQLQPPYFDPGASVAVNCGSTGFTIGHELTHGFDDYGSQFDHAGRLVDWWQPLALETYKEAGECVVRQFNAFELLPGTHLNGKLTLGESIADLGGVKLAYHAYRAMRAGATEPIVADGYNEDQQFFLSYGQGWCAKYRDEYLRDSVATELHPPAKPRVNGPLANMPEFAAVFSCAQGSPMAPTTRCSVWQQAPATQHSSLRNTSLAPSDVEPVHRIRFHAHDPLAPRRRPTTAAVPRSLRGPPTPLFR